MYIYNISLNYSRNEKSFRQKLSRKSKTHFVFSNFFTRKSYLL